MGKFKQKIGKPLVSSPPSPGKSASAGRPASPGKSAAAPGQRKKALGLTSAKTLTKGYAKKSR